MMRQDQNSKTSGKGRLEGQGVAEEVHAEEAGQERHRQEHDGDERQRLHDVVGAVGDRRQVRVEGAGDQVAEALRDIVDADEVVVDVAEVDAMVGVDRVVLVAGQAVEDLALGGQDPVQPQFAERLTRKIACSVLGVGWPKTSSCASSMASSRCSIAGRYSATLRSSRW